MKPTQEKRKTALAYLRRVLRPGKTVYFLVRSRSKSGMSKRLDFFTLHKGVLVPLTGWFSWVLDIPMGFNAPRDGLIIKGCGFDPGFHTVYNIGRTLWPKGFKLAKNQYGRNGDKSGFDSDGGYALVSERL